ncbi:unnamed protein product [Cuscuta campestris]|uniref:RING-type domain-containing protein n=1 Tax=Cuscuta campestris TaxID=132261 RepID=A0A484MZ71_9ASTE|nr:unnamed protein product [Cuscuta campestris]
MEGGEALRTTWRSFKRRLQFSGIACCGSPRSLRVPSSTISDEEAQLKDPAQIELAEEDDQEEEMQRGRFNLAMALAAERDSRRAAPAAQMKTLVRLFEEADGREGNSAGSAARDGGGGGGGVGGPCGVCGERNRGAALIPCGHTYCRACSREFWSNGGSCPSCNRPIRDILPIF